VTPAPFPWREAIGIGLAVLRLPPEAFWRMTPREFAAALGVICGPAGTPLERGGLRELMERFPDGR
jgi:uncharacterized phage protein (TIGR02216 family)